MHETLSLGIFSVKQASNLNFSHFRAITPYTKEQPLHSPMLRTGVVTPNEYVNHKEGVQWRDVCIYKLLAVL